jgi:predicted peroxiredoxin
LKMEYELQVIIVAGPEDPRRAIAGFAMAASACCAGTKVGVYLVMDAARFVSASNCSKILAQGFPSVREFIEAIHESGGAVEYCPACLNEECAQEVKQHVVETEMCRLARPSGMSSFGMRMAQIPTVVF